MLIGISQVGGVEVGGLINPAMAPVAPVTPDYKEARGRVIREYDTDRKIIARKNKMGVEIVTKSLSKRASETLDYDFDFTEFLGLNTDTVASADVTVLPSGASLNAKYLYSTIVKQWISGGTVGQTYSIICAMTSTLGRIKKLELLLTIRGE